MYLEIKIIFKENDYFDFWTPDWEFLSRTGRFLELPVLRTWSFSEQFVNTGSIVMLVEIVQYI